MDRNHLFILVVALATTSGARADWMPDAVFVEVGASSSSSHSLTAGAQWSWAWQGSLGNTQATAYTEVFVSHWNARDKVTLAGLLPMVRLRLRNGQSPWFMEGGIGATVSDSLYRNHGKAFSTRFNFVDVVGVGRSLDAQRTREVTLRLSHVSNANIKKPNPGENFVQLRYAVRF